MNKKPIIGLSATRMRLEGSYLTGMQKSLVNSEYIDAITRAGGLSVMIPPTSTPEDIEEYLNLCDGVLITGGLDIAPLLYGEMTIAQCGSFDPEVDRSNLALVKTALRRKLPLLGICRGIQLLNVALGGSLYQDIAAQRPGGINHATTYMRCDTAHPVQIMPDSPLHTIFPQPEILVNSLHHQGIKDLGAGLSVAAVAPDGVIEAVYLPKEPVMAVQWHPEMMLVKDNAMLILFQSFIHTCKSQNSK